MTSHSEILQQVRALVSELFLVPEDEIDEHSSPASILAWDSMNQLNLILELEQTFGIEMTQERVQQMTDVGAIVRIVESAL